ncbi:MAG: hypothetical protein ABW047_00515 [Nitrospiraceae bacterium]
MISPRWLVIALSAVCALVFAGCSGKKVTTKLLVQPEKYRVQKIAIVPFETIATPQVLNLDGPSFSVPDGAKRSNISVAIPSATEGSPRIASKVRASAADTVTDLVWNKLKVRPGLQAVPPEQARNVIQNLRLKMPDQSAGEVAPKVAERLGADAALIGKVAVYQERVGSRLGANPPAVVGFDITLVARDGTILWEGSYYERQRPMSEDLWGFIERRGAFVTADELAEYGAERLAKEFPYGGSASD